jgi:hypothetical protein
MYDMAGGTTATATDADVGSGGGSGGEVGGEAGIAAAAGVVSGGGSSEEVGPEANAELGKDEAYCNYACENAVMTAEEAEKGYCSGRRCKNKLHHFCFLAHAGEAADDLGLYTRFCQACWALQPIQNA